MLHPPPPNFGAYPAALTQGFETRLQWVPFDRVRNWADYWALQAVEGDHLGRLARQYNLTDRDRESIETWWLAQVDAQLGGTYARLISQLHTDSGAYILRSARWQLRSTFLFQVWFNTVGPG